MNNILLIAIAIMCFITMISCVISTVLIVSKSKEKELVVKISKVLLLIIIILGIIGVAVGVTFVKKDDSSEDNKTTLEQVSLEEAGFNEVSLDEYLELIKQDEKNIVLVARPTCSFCEKFTPVLKKATEDMNLTVNYINTDDFSDDDFSKFESSLDYLSSNEWGTPLVLITKNNEVVDVNSGYVELDTIKDFFEKNELGE